MLRAQGFSRLNRSGMPAPLATVTVYLTGTNVLATLYQTNATTSPKANPFTAGLDGSWYFYAGNGRYDVAYSGGGITTPWAEGDVSLFDFQATQRGLVYAADFGAVGDGSADDAPAINAAINSLDPILGGEVVLSGGTYLLNSPIIIRRNCIWLHGRGVSATHVYTSNPAGDVIQILGVPFITISDLTISSPGVTKTAGAGIYLGEDPLSPGTAPTFTLIRRVEIINHFYGIQIEAGTDFTIDTCVIANALAAGITLRNTVNPDQGDGTILNCNLSGPPSSIGIAQFGLSGIRVLNNKILGFSVAYQMTIPAALTANLSDFIIIGNSFEAQRDAHIQFTRQAPSTTVLGAVIIANNQMGGVTLNPGGVGINIQDVTTIMVIFLLIEGNIIDLQNDSSGIVLGSTAYGIVQGNIIFGRGAGHAILVAADCDRVQIGVNATYGTYAPGGVIVNLSPTGNIQPPATRAVVTWNPGVIADGAAVSVDVAVPAADLLDPAVAAMSALPASALQLSAQVTSPGHVRVVLVNRTGAPVTVASGSLAVAVWKYFTQTIGS